MRNEWLAGGGAFLILGVAWIVVGLLFIVFALRNGASRGEEADGCVLAIGTFVTMSVGGGIGLQIAPYPWFILSALFLGIAFPSLLVWSVERRRRRRN